jgi:predicted PurR-regulated permease PerM
MTFIEILTAVVLVLSAVLCLALIFYLGRITKSVKQLQDNITELSGKLSPLISSLSELSSKLYEISNEASNQIDASKRIVSNVKEQVDKYVELGDKIRLGIEDPVDKILSNFKAIANGVSTFFNHLKK